MHNGGISNFYPLLFIHDKVDVAQNLQGLSYEVCSTAIATIFRTQIIYSSFSTMRHYTPATYCYVMKIYEIHLYFINFNKTRISLQTVEKNAVLPVTILVI